MRIGSPGSAIASPDIVTLVLCADAYVDASPTSGSRYFFANFLQTTASMDLRGNTFRGMTREQPQNVFMVKLSSW